MKKCAGGQKIRPSCVEIVQSRIRESPDELDAKAAKLERGEGQSVAA
jgi:hypothetical protein